MTTQISQTKKLLGVVSLGALLLSLATGCKTGINTHSHTDAKSPVIISQTSADVFNKAEQPVELKVSARGDGPLYYQWFYQPVDGAAAVLAEEHNEKIEGATSPTLRISRTKESDTGFYWCRVSREDLKRGGIFHTQSQPVFLYAMSHAPGYGVIRSGTTTKICSTVGTHAAYAVITTCPDGSVLWKPNSPGAQVTVSIPAYPTAWIACKVIGSSTPSSPCSGRGSLTFTNPAGASQMWFTVYFPTKPTASGVTMTWTGITPNCPP